MTNAGLMKKNRKTQIQQLIIILSIGLIALTTLFASPALAADLANGVKVFDVHCAGCHPNGSNIVRRGKSLKKKALQKNGVETLESIVSLVANGKNNMSAYRDRLSAKEIEDVSAYVLERAAKDWR
jgi:cytochrome c6